MELCGNPKPKRKRARIEVFSAVLENKDQGIRFERVGFKGYFGVVLLHSCNRNYVIFDSPVVGPQLIHPREGHLTLTDPECSIPVEDKVIIFPWFILLFICAMDRGEHLLWNADVDGMDQLICRTIQCFFQLDLHVNFAVYRDPMESHLDVYFVHLNFGEEDALIQVHGTVSASNSVLSGFEAKSILFHKLSGECVTLEAGKSVPLPLSRRMIVLPRHSTLHIHVSLQIRMCGLDFSFEEMVESNCSSGYAGEFFLSPNHANCGKLLVKVTWVECEDRLE